MPDIPQKPKFELVQGGDSDARLRLHADLVLADPALTRGMVTQDVFDGLLESEIRDERRNGPVSIELLPVLGERIINRIVAALAVSNAKEFFNESAIRGRLQELLDVFLKNH